MLTRCWHNAFKVQSVCSCLLHFGRFSLRTHRQFKVETVIYYKRQPSTVSHSRLLEETSFADAASFNVFEMSCDLLWSTLFLVFSCISYWMFSLWWVWWVTVCVCLHICLRSFLQVYTAQLLEVQYCPLMSFVTCVCVHMSFVPPLQQEGSWVSDFARACGENPESSQPIRQNCVFHWCICWWHIVEL